jgi:putative spermidine/putrescine transport system substrate-binding protein
MRNVVQRRLDRRRVLKGGVGAAGAVAWHQVMARRAAAQDVPPAPSDASDLKALIAAAQEENAIVSYGMPPEWANYAEMWETFTTTYGIATWEDTDMGSAIQIAKFLVEKDNPVADIGDIGILFGPAAVQFGVCAPFKNDTWDEIPDWAKHPDGLWATMYYGNLAFWVNTDIVEPVPRTWQDLLQPEYAGLVTIDDPRTAAQGNSAVIAAAFANGGDETNVEPGLAYFKQMNDVGNLNPIGLELERVRTGETLIGVGWDYLGLAWRDELVNEVELEVVIPEDGSTVGPYVSIINKWAPHPNAARLMRNFILSPEGQQIYAKGYAKGYATPILPSVELPEEIRAKRPPPEAYAAVRPIENWPAAVASSQLIADRWAIDVLG